PAGLKWSNSSLSRLQNCGESYRRYYIERERLPKTARQHRGSAIHKAASMAYWRKWTGLELPTAEEAQDVAATEFRLLWDMGVRLDVDEAQRDLEAVRGEALDFVVDVAAFHVRAVAPLIEPIAVERRITVTPRNSDLVIDGILDLIDRVPANPILSQAGGE